MAKRETVETTVEQPVETPAEAEIPQTEAPTYKEYKALIEKYKAVNPAKYELKKEELERKLAALK